MYNASLNISLQASRSDIAKLRNQIESSLRGVGFSINSTNITRANAAIGNLAATTKKASKEALTFSDIIALKGVNFVQYTIATTFVLKLAGAISTGVRESIQFEKEMAVLAQTVNKTNAETLKYSQSILNISKSYGLAQKKTAELVRILAQAGLTIKEATSAADVLARTTLIGTFDDLNSTTEAFIALMASFKMDVNDAAKALDAINSVSKRYAVESADLVEAIKRTGGAFKAAGGDINELIALFTSVRSFSRESADTIATAFRTIFARVSRPKTIEYFRQLGIELTNLKGDVLDPFNAIKALSEGLNKLGIQAGSVKFAEVVEQIGGIRQISKVIPLITNFSNAQKALKIANEGVAESDADVAKAKETLAFKIQALKENFSSLITEITQTSNFKVLANIIISMANGVVELTRSLKNLIPVLGLLGAVRLGGAFSRMLTKGRASSIVGSGSGIIGANKGGFIPGTGDTDTVPAMLTPGEFVINKKSAKAFGYGNLRRINKYAKGGKVQYFSKGSDGPVKPTGQKTLDIISQIRSKYQPPAEPKKGAPTKEEKAERDRLAKIKEERQILVARKARAYALIRKAIVEGVGPKSIPNYVERSRSETIEQDIELVEDRVLEIEDSAAKLKNKKTRDSRLQEALRYKGVELAKLGVTGESYNQYNEGDIELDEIFGGRQLISDEEYSKMLEKIKKSAETRNKKSKPIKRQNSENPDRPPTPTLSRKEQKDALDYELEQVKKNYDPTVDPEGTSPAAEALRDVIARRAAFNKELTSPIDFGSPPSPVVYGPPPPPKNSKKAKPPKILEGGDTSSEISRRRGEISQMISGGSRILSQNPQLRQELLTEGTRRSLEKKGSSYSDILDKALSSGKEGNLKKLKKIDLETPIEEVINSLDEVGRAAILAWQRSQTEQIQQINPTSFQEVQTDIEEPVVAPLPNAVPLPPKKKKQKAKTTSFQETSPSIEQQINNTVSERAVVEEERLDVARESLKQESEASKATPIPQIVTATASIAEVEASRTKLMRKRSERDAKAEQVDEPRIIPSGFPIPPKRTPKAQRDKAYSIYKEIQREQRTAKYKAIEESKKIEEMKTAEFQIGSTPSSPEEKRRNKEAKKARRELRKKQKYSEEMYPFFRSDKHFSDMDQNEFDEWFRREKLDPGSIGSWERERRDKAIAAATKNKTAGYSAPLQPRQLALPYYPVSPVKKMDNEEPIDVEFEKRLVETRPERLLGYRKPQQLKLAISPDEMALSFLNDTQTNTPIINRGILSELKKEQDTPPISGGGNLGPVSPQQTASVGIQIGEKIGGSIISKLSGGLGGIAALLAPQILESFQGGDQTTQNKLFDAFVSLTSKTAQLGIQASIAKSAFTSLGDAVKEGVRKYRESTRIREELDKRLKVAKEAEYSAVLKMESAQQDYAIQLAQSKKSSSAADLEESVSAMALRNAPSEYEQKRQNSLQAVSLNSGFSQRVFQQNPSLNQVANAQQNITPLLNQLSQDRSEIGALGLASIEYEEARRSAAQTGADKQYRMQGKGQKRRKDATKRLNKEVAELTNIYGANSQELKDVQDILERYKNSVIRQDAAVQAYSQAMRKATEKVNNSVLSVKPAGVFGPASNLTGSASIQSRISALQGQVKADEATIANDPDLRKLAKAQRLLTKELETTKQTYGENSTELNDVNTILGMYPDNVILQLAAVKKYTTTVNKARVSLDQTITTANNAIASARLTATRDKELADTLKERAEAEKRAADAATQEVKQTQSAIDRRGLFGGYKQDVATVYGKSRGVFGFGKQRSLPETATDDERMAFQAAQGRIGNVKAGLGMAVGAAMTVGVGAASASYDYAAKNLRQLADSAIQAGSAQEAYTTTLEALNAEATSNNITNYASIGAGIGSMLGPYGAAIGMGLGALAAVYLGDVTDYIGLTNKAQERELAARDAYINALTNQTNKIISETQRKFNGLIRSDVQAAAKVSTRGLEQLIGNFTNPNGKDLSFNRGEGVEIARSAFDQSLTQLDQILSTKRFQGKTQQELEADPAISGFIKAIKTLSEKMGEEAAFKSFFDEKNASNAAIRIETQNRLRLIAIQTQEIATRNSIANTLVAWDNALIKTSNAIQELEFEISRSQPSATFDTSLTDLSARNIRNLGFTSSLRASSELSPTLNRVATGVYNALSKTQGLGIKMSSGNIQGQGVEQIIRSAFSGLDPRIAEDLITRLVNNEITSANIEEEIAKAIQPFAEELENGRKSINDTIERQKKQQEAQIEYEQKILDMKLETIKSQEKADRAISEIFNVFTTASEEVDNRIRKANIALRKTGVVGQLTGGPQDLKIIALRDQEIKQRQKEIAARLMDNRSSAQERFALQAEFSSLTAESAKLNQAMSILADTSEEVSAAQRELEQSQEIRKAFKDAAIQLAFGTTESRNEFFKTKNQAFATSAFGTAEVIPEEDRGGVLSFLQQFKNFRGFAGGQTGGEVIQRVAANYLAQIGVPLQQIPIVLDDFIAGEMSLVDIQRQALKLDAERNDLLSRLVIGQGFADGGIVHKKTGGSIFKPKGTDTVPAMLTPGEFVVKRSAVQKYGTGMLKEINSGYYQDGGLVGGAAGFNKSPKQNIISGNQAREQFLQALSNKRTAKNGSFNYDDIIDSFLIREGIIQFDAANKGKTIKYTDLYNSILNSEKIKGFGLNKSLKKSMVDTYYQRFLRDVINKKKPLDESKGALQLDAFDTYQRLIDSLFGANTGGAGKDAGGPATVSGNLSGFYLNKKGQLIFETGENFQQISSERLPGVTRGSGKTRRENIEDSFAHVAGGLKEIGFFDTFPQYRKQFDALKDSLIREDQIGLFKPTTFEIELAEKRQKAEQEALLQQQENEKIAQEQLEIRQKRARDAADEKETQQLFQEINFPQPQKPKGNPPVKISDKELILQRTQEAIKKAKLEAEQKYAQEIEKKKSQELPEGTPIGVGLNVGQTYEMKPFETPVGTIDPNTGVIIKTPVDASSGVSYRSSLTGKQVIDPITGNWISPSIANPSVEKVNANQLELAKNMLRILSGKSAIPSFLDDTSLFESIKPRTLLDFIGTKINPEKTGRKIQSLDLASYTPSYYGKERILSSSDTSSVVDYISDKYQKRVNSETIKAINLYARDLNNLQRKKQGLLENYNEDVFNDIPQANTLAPLDPASQEVRDMILNKNSKKKNPTVFGFTPENFFEIGSYLFDQEKRNEMISQYNENLQKTKYSKEFNKLLPVRMLQQVLPGFASGGLVDSIPARLTAGEFVMSKKATESIGPKNLANMNKLHGYSTGGYVTKKGPAYLQGGGTVRGGVDQNIGLSASQLMQFNNKFSDTVQKLIEMPKVFEISLETVGVNVNLNGAEFLAKLPSVLQSIILEKIQSEIGNIAAKVKQNLMSGN